MIATRACDGCTMCCFLLPVRSIGKKAHTKCQHQVEGGCGIYAQRPFDCFVWSCAWALGADLDKPSEAGYLIDASPDFVTVAREGEADVHIPVLQVWLDPERPDAHRSPLLRDFLDAKRIPGLCRVTNQSEGFVLVPPSIASDNKWHALTSNVTMEHEHSADEIAAVWGQRQ